jgi:hypothetical protein
MSITNGYATLALIKSAARITDQVDDAMLEICVESASRLIDEHCERRFFTAGTETRYYRANSSWWCDVDDIAGTAITVKTAAALDGVYDTTWKAADVQFEPLNRTSSGLSWPVTRLRAVQDYLFPTDLVGEAAVEVTAVFGFGTAVPIQVQQAAVLLGLRLFKRLDSPLGVLGVGPDLGVVRVGRIDADVQAILHPFRRSAVGVA